MKISVDNLDYFKIQECTDWLDQNVSKRRFYLHNQRGGIGWSYYSTERTIEIEDEQMATLFILKFGGQC